MTAFRRLLAAHVAEDPAEATLVLAAIAAFLGLKADGSAMTAEGTMSPTLRQIAAELGLHVGAARRGVQHLAAAGVVTVDRGVTVTPGALRARWERRCASIGLPRDLRELGLRSEPLLVAGLVHDNLDARGRLVMGTERLMARTGLARRTLQRAIAGAETAGAIHRWTIPGRWLLCMAPGRRRESAQEKQRESARGNDPPRPPRRETAQENASAERREPAQVASRTGAPPVANRRRSRREPAHATPDCSGVLRSTPEARVARGADRPADRKPEPDPEIELQSAILRTGLRSRLRPFDRLRFAMQLGKPLLAVGMTPADVAELWSLAQRKAKDPDAGGLLAHWLAGDWRGVLAEGPAKDKHAELRARGATAAAAGEEIGQITIPQNAAAIASELLARTRQA